MHRILRSQLGETTRWDSDVTHPGNPFRGIGGFQKAKARPKGPLKVASA